MLATIPKQHDSKWLECHEINRLNKPKTISKSFDHEVLAKEKNGYPYDPFQFHEQWSWIQTTFYKIQSGHSQLIKRQFENGDPDNFINAPEIHATLERKFGHALHPLINEWAIYYIGTTAGEKYDPSTSDDFVEIEHTRYRNSYRPPVIKPNGRLMERPPMWQEYLDRLMPPKNVCTTFTGRTLPQQVFFEAYIAQRLQQPAIPPLIAVLLRGEHGTGKNYWMDNILRPLIGENNYTAVTLADIQKTFNKDLYSKLLVHIEEINDSRGKAGEKMKKLITEESARVEAKYENAAVVKKYFGIVMSSNAPDPVRIEQNDRRYFVPVWSKHLLSTSETKVFFGKLTDWLYKEGSLQQLCNYFHSLNIDDFDFRFPPSTVDKYEITEQQTASEDNVNTAAIVIADQYQDHVFSLTDVVKEWHISQSNAKRALKLAGFASVKRRWTSGDSPHACWVHKSLIPADKDWSNVSYSLFTRRNDCNPTINAQSGHNKMYVRK